jgi:hypothetical protein
MRKHFFFGNAAKGISFSSCLAGKMGRKNVMTPYERLFMLTASDAAPSQQTVVERE